MKRSMRGAIGALIMTVVMGGAYLATGRGWVLAQSPPPAVCSNATLQGEFALVVQAMFEGTSTIDFNSFAGTLSFDGVGTLQGTVTTRRWSVFGNPLALPGTLVTATETISGSYNVNPDCTMQLMGVNVRILPGGPQPSSRTMLLLDAANAPTEFQDIDPGPNVILSRTLHFTGIGIGN